MCLKRKLFGRAVDYAKYDHKCCRRELMTYKSNGLEYVFSVPMTICLMRKPGVGTRALEKLGSILYGTIMGCLLPECVLTEDRLNRQVGPLGVN